MCFHDALQMLGLLVRSLLDIARMQCASCSAVVLLYMFGVFFFIVDIQILF